MIRVFLVMSLFWGIVPAIAGTAYIDKTGVIRYYAVAPQNVKATVNLEAIIQKAGKRYGIEPALIRAVIRVESNFRSSAVSPKGAKGLMQIMPGNFKQLGISNPFDPEQNVMGGTSYLRFLLIRYNKRLSFALAAYNAGPSSVDKCQGVPPIKETQAYLKKVVHYYRLYKNIDS